MVSAKTKWAFLWDTVLPSVTAAAAAAAAAAKNAIKEYEPVNAAM